MVNSPLIRPAIYWGEGGLGGGTLDSHEDTLDIQIPPEVWCFRYVFGGPNTFQ